MDEVRAEAFRLFFEKNTLSTANWRESSSRLLEAAALIEPSLKAQWAEVRPIWSGQPVPLLGLHGTYLMLVAFGIENLLKGLILKKLPDAAIREAERGNLPSILRTHNLLRLAKEINLELSSREEYQLWRLSRFATFAGRYPVALTDDEGARGEPGEGRSLDANQLIDGDFEVSSQVVALLLQMF